MQQPYAHTWHPLTNNTLHTASAKRNARRLHITSSRGCPAGLGPCSNTCSRAGLTGCSPPGVHDGTPFPHAPSASLSPPPPRSNMHGSSSHAPAHHKDHTRSAAKRCSAVRQVTSSRFTRFTRFTHFTHLKRLYSTPRRRCERRERPALTQQRQYHQLWSCHLGVNVEAPSHNGEYPPGNVQLRGFLTPPGCLAGSCCCWLPRGRCLKVLLVALALLGALPAVRRCTCDPAAT